MVGIVGVCVCDGEEGDEGLLFECKARMQKWFCLSLWAWFDHGLEHCRETMIREKLQFAKSSSGSVMR